MAEWTNLSYANVATTSPTAHRISSEWADSLARGGAAEFDGEAEKEGMMPLREAASKLLSCGIGDVCVGSSATELLCSLAWAISPPEGSNVVSSRVAFPSTVYPWARVCESNGAEIRLAEHDDSLYTDPNDILSLIDERTSVVTVSHVEFSNGQRYDLEKLSEAAHSVGALLIVDATQSMGMVPIEAHSTKADAIVSSGYKWLRGTYGAAVGYISPAVVRDLNPGLMGFRSNADLWDLRADRLVLPEDASRFEYTTIHFGAALGLAAAIEELVEIGMEEVWRHDLELVDSLVRGISGMEVEISSPLSEEERSAIVSLRLPSGNSSVDVADRLQSEYSILVTSRSGLLRVSPHIDNSLEDIESLVSALGEILS
ncbi:MAG: aminotransferase class V-fold PLP-dependent enzyme [Candidatus Thalassarchaeaceae archaeon]